VSLRSLWNITEKHDLDLWLRYVSELETQNIDKYVTLDAKATWRLMPQLELSLVGRNLLEDDHAEFVEEFGAQQPAEIPREAYIEALLHF
jgi:iron complex outermembrane receptor protein